MAIQTLEGYFRSHPLPSERIEQIRKLIAENNWGGLNHERDLEVAYIFWTERARRAYEAGHYSEAAGLAQHSLEMRRDQVPALMVLGQRGIRAGEFCRGGRGVRKDLELTPPDDELIGNYGDALAARHTPAAVTSSIHSLGRHASRAEGAT